MRSLRKIGCFFLFLALTMPACQRDSGKVKVAFISNNPFDFWRYAQRGTEKAAGELGVVAEFKMPARGTAEEQQRIMEDLLTRGVQGIAISPNDAANLSDFLKDKVASRVPLITVDSDVPDPKARRAFLGTHNYRAGRAAGELVEKAAPEGGKVIIFVGKMDVQNAVERRQGVIDYLSGIKNKNDEVGELSPPGATDLKMGKYVLVKTQTDGADASVCQSRAEELLGLHPDVVAIVGLWEYNPPAMLRAVKSVKHKTAVVGFDENEETLQAVRSGEIAGTIVQSPFLFGYEAVKILTALAKGDDKVLKNRKDMDDQGRIFVPHQVITKDNVDAFQAELKKLKGS